MEEEINSLDLIWENVTKHLQEIFGRPSYEAYIENICHLMKIEKNNAYVVCDQKVSLKILSQDSQLDKFKKAFEEATGTNYNVLFYSQKDYVNLDKKKEKKETSKPDLFDQYIISSKDTFDTFVVGQSNKQAYLACNLLCEDKVTFNQLFIYADSGLGKTHLLSAIYNKYREVHPDKKIKYVCVNDFIELYIRYVREEQNKTGDAKVSDIKDYFVDLDCVLFDDIQFLTAKRKTQEVFFDIFNKLQMRNVIVVMTSDCSPDHIQDLDKRLVSRFSSGLSCFIKIPERSTMIDILKKKIELNGLDINMFPDEVLDYIASKNSNNVRLLEGALNRLLFLLALHKDVDKVDMKFVRMAFEDSRNYSKELDQDHVLDVEDIISEVANQFNLTIGQLKSKVRTSQISYARQIAMYLCRDLLNESLNDIGRVFGKDHSTVLDACKKITKRMEEDVNLKKTIKKLKDKLKK